MRLLAQFAATAGLLLAALMVRGEDSVGSDSARPEVRRPLPALAAFARAHGIPLDGIEAAPPPGGPRVGDTVEMLVTYFEKDSYKQWLVELRRGELTAADRVEYPARDLHLYLASGGRGHYDEPPMRVELRVVGPFEARPEEGGDDEAPADKRSHAVLDEPYLNVGLQQAAALLARLSPELVRHPVNLDKILDSSPVPFPPEVLAHASAEKARLGVSDREEWWYIGAVPALSEFFGMVMKSPDLRSIFFHVVKLPSIWSMVSSGGIHTDILLRHVGVREVDRREWNQPGVVYRLPIDVQLNRKPAFLCDLTVADPKPPLQTSVGLLEVAAGKPDDESKPLILRVVATRSGAGAAELARR